MIFINVMKVFIFCLIVFLTAPSVVCFIMTPAVPFIFLNRRIYFRWCSFMVGSLLLMATCLLEDLLGIKIVITGDDLAKDKKRSLVILNHRTRLDWMYIWMLHSRFQTLEQLKIALKAPLIHLPIAGWIAQHAGYLFVERKWEKDQQIMKNMTGYYKSSQAPISLLIFPEGTNLHDLSKAKSNNYASKQATYNRSYNYCLHPRRTGFTYLLKTMRSENIIDAVDDVTIGYEGKFPVTEIDLLKGCIPKVVHFHVKRYNINDLPKEDEKINQWLEQHWDEKEDQLEKFYTEDQFDLPSKRLYNKRIESTIRFQRRVLFIFWNLFNLFWLYCFIAFIQIKIYVLIVCLFHLAMEIFTNGILNFVCQLDKNSREKKQSIIKHD